MLQKFGNSTSGGGDFRSDVFVGEMNIFVHLAQIVGTQSQLAISSIVLLNLELTQINPIQASHIDVHHLSSIRTGSFGKRKNAAIFAKNMMDDLFVKQVLFKVAPERSLKLDSGTKSSRLPRFMQSEQLQEIAFSTFISTSNLT